MTYRFYSPPKRNPPGLNFTETLDMAGYGQGYGGGFLPSFRYPFMGGARLAKPKKKRARKKLMAGGTFGEGIFGNGVYIPSASILGAGRKRTRRGRRKSQRGQGFDFGKLVKKATGLANKAVKGIEKARDIAGKVSQGVQAASALASALPLTGQGYEAPRRRRTRRGAGKVDFKKVISKIGKIAKPVISTVGTLAPLLKLVGLGEGDGVSDMYMPYRPAYVQGRRLSRPMQGGFNLGALVKKATGLANKAVKGIEKAQNIAGKVSQGIQAAQQIASALPLPLSGSGYIMPRRIIRKRLY